jgi:DNA invertase Pin-like site-specific DNA recombinase
MSLYYRLPVPNTSAVKGKWIMGKLVHIANFKEYRRETGPEPRAVVRRMFDKFFRLIRSLALIERGSPTIVCSVVKDGGTVRLVGLNLTTILTLVAKSE